MEGRAACSGHRRARRATVQGASAKATAGDCGPMGMVRDSTATSARRLVFVDRGLRDLDAIDFLRGEGRRVVQEIDFSSNRLSNRGLGQALGPGAQASGLQVVTLYTCELQDHS